MSDAWVRVVALCVVLAFTICYWLVPPIGLSGLGQQLTLGAGLAMFMALFDIAMAMLLLHKPWRKVAPDFDPRTGNYLVFGLVFLTITPALVSAIRAPT